MGCTPAPAVHVEPGTTVEDLLDLLRRDSMCCELSLILIIKEEIIDVKGWHAKPLTVCAHGIPSGKPSSSPEGTTHEMRQEFLILAERAEAANGKIFIHGGAVERHFAASFPTTLSADIAASMLVGWGETNETHVLELRVSDEDENPVIEIQAEMTPGRPAQAKPAQELRQLIAIKGPFPIGKAGQYKLQAFADGVAQEPPFRFWVEQADQPGPVPPNRQSRRHPAG